MKHFILKFLLLSISVTCFAQVQLTERDFDLLKRFQSDSMKAAGIPDQTNKIIPPVYTIYISESMGEPLIKETLLSAKSALESGINVRLAIRGINPDETFGDAMRRNIDRAYKYGTDEVLIEIDPPSFDKNFVSRVPTIVREENGSSTDRIEGAIDALYLFNITKNLNRNGKQFINHNDAGETFEISEQNMIEQLQAKAADIDWKEKAKQGLERYWEKKVYETLPPVRADSTRQFDPSMLINEDYYAEGKLVFPKGTVLNPFDLAPIVTSYLIFNPTRKEELEFARLQVIAFKNKSLMLIATEFPRDDSLERAMELQDVVRGAIYLLDTQVRERFKVKATPTLITPNNITKSFTVIEKKV